ncbi:MAG TPA: sialidase family protein [Actinomycetota bacterium]
MRLRLMSSLAALALVVGGASQAQGTTGRHPRIAGRPGIAANTRVTVDDTSGTYLRYDGTSDDTTDACSTGRRSQNEPTVAVDPSDSSVMTSGSNDYCTAIVNGDVWAGYYRSTDGGASWQDSLVPGYPADTSPAGLASPAHGVCGAAGDPTQSFDSEGRLFYGFICFNRSKPTNGSLYVASYVDHGAAYVRTVRVDRGTPSVWGLFQDKINVVADSTGGPNDGNVYVAWARYPGQSANNAILFSRSTDHGATFSRPYRITHGSGEEQFADLAVGPDGTVYLTWREIAHQHSTHDAVYAATSTDGGVSFSHPVEVAAITPFDSDQFSGNGFGDCGDSIFFSCPTGLTYSRFSSISAVAADATGAHIVWSARNADGQARIYASNSSDGVHWSDPAPLDGVATGHQWFPDVASADGTITAVFYDSRNDPAYSPDLPPGDTADGRNSGDAVSTFVAKSADGGSTWTESEVTTAGSNFGWETHGARRVGFWGDYIYVSAVPGVVQVAWTDSRDLLAGQDPREPQVDDGFDVLNNCTYVPNDIDAPSYSSPTIDDPCLSQGGLDQNIYAASA